jgi:hypothetical protein
MKTQLDLRPVFLVTDHEKTQSRFWCGFCQSWHYHGRIKEGEVDSRVAHCHLKDSPLRERDYYITKDPKIANSAMLRMWQEILDLRAQLEEPQ